MNKKRSIVNDIGKIKIIIFIMILVFLLPVVYAQSPTKAPDLSQGGETVTEFLKIFFPEGGSSQGSIPANEVRTGAPSTGSKSGGNPQFVFYCQGNTQWQNSCSLDAAGCGPSSLAMVLSSLGIPMTPPQVDAVFRQNGWRTCSDEGSYMMNALASEWLSNLGIEVSENLAYNGILNLQHAKTYLDKGYFIIGSSKEFPCANCRSLKRIDHIFAVDEVDISNAQVSIRDPNNCSYADGNDENSARIMMYDSAFTWYYAFALKKR